MKCPVCHTQVVANVGGLNIQTHRDRVGGLCPAAGQPIRICEDEF